MAVEEWIAITLAFLGIVLVFCLFTALRHRELNSMRRLIALEELETEDARTRLSELSALFQVSTTLNLHLIRAGAGHRHHAPRCARWHPPQVAVSGQMVQLTG